MSLHDVYKKVHHKNWSNPFKQSIQLSAAFKEAQFPSTFDNGDKQETKRDFSSTFKWHNPYVSYASQYVIPRVILEKILKQFPHFHCSRYQIKSRLFLFWLRTSERSERVRFFWQKRGKKEVGKIKEKWYACAKKFFVPLTSSFPWNFASGPTAITPLVENYQLHPTDHFEFPRKWKSALNIRK